MHCLLQKGGLSAFHVSAARGHVAVTQYLAPLMEGRCFATDSGGYTALHWAAQKGHLAIVEYLITSCGLDVKARDKVGPHHLLIDGFEFYCIV